MLLGFYWKIENIEEREIVFSSYHAPAVLKEWAKHSYDPDCYQLILCFGNSITPIEVAHLRVDWIDDSERGEIMRV